MCTSSVKYDHREVNTVGVGAPKNMPMCSMHGNGYFWGGIAAVTYRVKEPTWSYWISTLVSMCLPTLLQMGNITCLPRSPYSRWSLTGSALAVRWTDTQTQVQKSSWAPPTLQ